MKIAKTLMITSFLMACAAHASYADENTDLLSKDRFQVRVRAVSVRPDVDSRVDIGGNVDDISDRWAPELDLTYFPMEQLGLELIAATTKHSVHYNIATHLGDTWVLPPTLTVQYHPLRGSDHKFSPYVGAGLNYSMFYGEDSGSGFNNLDVKGGVGYALQIGADYWINKNWGLNIDAKKMWLDINAEVYSGLTPIHADIDLDPWVVGAGVSYRF
jgi:outer membrane protein